MRINEWNQRNQNAAKMNGPGGVQGKGNTKKLGDISTKSCKIKPEEDSFRSSLQKSMVQEEAMKAQVKKAEEAGRPGGQPLRQLGSRPAEDGEYQCLYGKKCVDG